LDTGVAPEPKSADTFREMLMSSLSLGGCFIKTQVPEPPGAMVMLRFALPGVEDSMLVKAVGRVCWTKDGRDGPPGMGVQFVRVDDEDLMQLSNYVAGLLDGDMVQIEHEVAA
jgi:uncharacterized protein (TIGR02266 family)